MNMIQALALDLWPGAFDTQHNFLSCLLFDKQWIEQIK